MPKISKKELQEWETKARAAYQLIKRYEETKILTYRPASPKHLKFHESTKPIRVVFGGNRSGKSFLGLFELLFHACFKTHPITKQPNHTPGKYRIFTTKFQIAEELIIPLLKEWVPKKVLINGSWIDSYSDRYHLLKLANGTTIDILTYDQDANVAESVELDGVWADEEMPERMFSGTITRLISRKGKFWLTVTPLYSLTWAMKFWEKVDDPTIDVFKLSIHDNPYLPPKERDAIIANWPEHERAARERGEFLEFGGLVYKELDSKIHFLHDWKYPAYHCPVVLAVDPHPRKPTVCTWAAVMPDDTVVFFDELEIAGTAQDIVKGIQEKEKHHRYPTFLRLIDPAANKQVSGIGSGLTTLAEFENAGMSFSLADNSDAGYNAVHEYLSYDRTRAIDSLNHPRAYFTSDVPKTWDALAHLMWDEYKNKDSHDPKERVKDFQKDFPDCVRYTLAQRPSNGFGNIDPVPLNFSLNHD